MTLENRRNQISRLAKRSPLSFVAGTRALSAWVSSGKQISIESATGRSVSFYLGPGRRNFGNPDDPLLRGRGRVALILDRNILETSSGVDAGQWSFAPFDIGEVLYHWNEGSLPREYLPGFTREQLRAALRPISSLEHDFSQVLDECYEDPMDYFRPGKRPRPSLELDDLTSAIHKACTERWFGRVRPFSGALTFEVRSSLSVTVPDSAVLCVVLLDDEVTRRAIDTDELESRFGSRLRVVPTPQTIHHPDLPSALLESETTDFVTSYLAV
ncbi:hypothetical protein O4220_05850 [Rhodococcus ruber]|uniref:Uncharacterized protein n=1 Tax=Rhodococcus ruber TaxID=1830 RepID=A0ABT4MBZ4_9NOCA|nr:hypothetical protein [Rhodococcus ruber]MCZ4518035.1 hypothetical protein [Rhodococcus ruber]